VRLRDEVGAQHAWNFARKAGRDPELYADAFDATVQTDLDDGSYIDPSSGTVTLQGLAQNWHEGRTHDIGATDNVKRRLRLHVYAELATPGVTPTGAAGDRAMEKRPSEPVPCRHECAADYPA
jgi:hypothetical protein